MEAAVPSPAFRTPAGAPRWQRVALYSPLARIVLFALAAMALFFGGFFLLRQVIVLKSLSPEVRGVIRFAVQVFASWGAYLLLVLAVERRRPRELALRSALPGTAAGALAGALLITAVVALMALGGSYVITGTTADVAWWPALLTAGLGAGISEEIIFRGVLYRISEEGLGTGWALAISGLFFGGVHLVNPGATPWSAFAIAIEAGLLLGLMYHVTRSLWPCIGLHAGWNFTQGTVWGIPVSGTVDPSFVQSARPGPEWLSGGVWGAEASVACVLLNLIAALVLWRIALRRGTWVPRPRRARPIMEAPTPSASARC